MKRLESIELFSGAGGLALGLHAAGFQHRALYEWNASAVDTLRFNKKMGHESLTDCEISRADVRDVDFKKYRGVDLVAGGPPCQPFSMGGNAAGMNDVRDMFPQAIRAVAEVKPRAFIFENVRGLLRPAFSNYVEYIRLQMEFPEYPLAENASWHQKGTLPFSESSCGFGFGCLEGGMRRARWIAPWKDSDSKPAIYHCISRVVERRFAFGAEEKEHFRMLMRMMENFTGCRVLSYCLMCNHIHLLVEVPPKPKEGISDQIFLQRLSALYSESFVAEVAAQLDEARHEGGVEGGNPERVMEIKSRFDYRMNDLGEFMKGLMQRFTQWFNGKHKRKGTLWEDRFKSVIVQSGTAARTMAAYIDLNPVRAGMVEDPAEYRWSSYGEAVGGGRKGNGKKAREGLVRAITSDRLTREEGLDASLWKDASRRYRRMLGMALERKTLNAKVETSGKMRVSQNDAEAMESGETETVLPELSMAAMLRHRVRYFTDGAVIGSKGFVDEAFRDSRERFSEKRKDGARRMRGVASFARDRLWSARDLRVGV